jgi:hypothetical protein
MISIGRTSGDEQLLPFLLKDLRTILPLLQRFSGGLG